MKIKITPTAGEKFRANRRRRGLTQEQCAEEVGVTPGTVRFWEDDTPSTPEVTIRFSKGEEYFAIRERLGLRLKEAAKMIGISHVYLIKLEKAKESSKALTTFYTSYIKQHSINI